MISVIIPVYKSASALKSCLSSLMEVDYPDPWEIIVVDDASQNGEEIARAASAFKVNLIRAPRHLGAAAARNQGVLLAKGEILLFIDADVVVRKNVLSRVASFFGDQRHSAVIGAYTKEIPEKNFAAVYKNLAHYYFSHDVLLKYSGYFWTACGAVRKNIFLGLGGFREDYFVIEDVEFGCRLRSAKYFIDIDREMQVTHLKQYSLWTLFVSDFLGRAIPLSKLIFQTKDAALVPEVSINSKLSIVAVYLLFVLFPLLMISNLFGSFLALTLSGIALFSLNRDFLVFIRKEQGGSFFLKSFLYLCFYYFYCGLGYLIGFILFFYESRLSGRRNSC